MKRKQGLFILAIAGFIALAAILLLPTGQKLKAEPTAAGISLTNTVQVNWNSGATAKSTNFAVSNTVGTNYGITWIGMNDTIVGSGEYISNFTTLSNAGNADAEFVLNFTSNDIAFNFGGDWTVILSNTNAPNQSGSSIAVTVAEASSVAILLYVFVPGTETNNAYVTFQCKAFNSNASADGGNTTTYTGRNGVIYGGNMGLDGAGNYNAWVTNTQADYTNWVLTVKVAVLSLAKTVFISNANPYQANTTVPYPGALLTYRIAYTNQGGAAAGNVRIRDTFPPANVISYVANSLWVTNNAFPPAMGNSIAMIDAIAGSAMLNGSDTTGNDLVATNGPNIAVFCPTNGTAGEPGADTGGTVNAGEFGSFFYQLTVD